MIRRVGQRVALVGGAGGEQELAHRGGEAEADGGDVAADELHRVVDRHARRDRTTGAVDVQPNVEVGVFTFQVQQLGADLIGDVVVDVGAEHDHAVLEQPVEHVAARIERALECHRDGSRHARRLPASIVERSRAAVHASSAANSAAESRARKTRDRSPSRSTPSVLF